MTIHLDFSQVSYNFSIPEKRRKIYAVIIINVILSVVLLVTQYQDYKTWQTTDAVLTKIEQEYKSASNGSQESEYILHYSYMVEEETYTGKEDFNGKVPDTEYEGKNVTIWYDPDEPSESSYEKPTLDPPMVPILLTLVICGCILGVRRRTNYIGF